MPEQVVRSFLKTSNTTLQAHTTLQSLPPQPDGSRDGSVCDEAANNRGNHIIFCAENFSAQRSVTRAARAAQEIIKFSHSLTSQKNATDGTTERARDRSNGKTKRQWRLLSTFEAFALTH